MYLYYFCIQIQFYWTHLWQYLWFLGVLRGFGVGAVMKWISHRQVLWDQGFLWLTSLDNVNKFLGFLQICMDFLKIPAVGLTFYASCKKKMFVIQLVLVFQKVLPLLSQLSLMSSLFSLFQMYVLSAIIDNRKKYLSGSSSYVHSRSLTPED